MKTFREKRKTIIAAFAAVEKCREEKNKTLTDKRGLPDMLKSARMKRKTGTGSERLSRACTRFSPLCGRACFPGFRGFLATVSIAAFLLIAFCGATSAEQVGGNGNRMPLTLKEALSLAERNNPMLAAARSDAVAADARIGMENSKRRPSMSATSFLTDGDMGGILAGPDSIMPRTFNIYQEKRYFDQNLMLMFPLDVSGRLARNAGGARHRGAAAKLDAEQARQETVLDVRMAYYRAAYGAEAVAAFEEAAAVAEEQLKNDTAMFDAGKVPAYYLDRARAEVAARKQMLAEARSAAGVARIRLAVLAGLDAAAPVDVADTLAVLADFLPASGVAPDGESPEIAAARERAAAAEKSENAARRSSAPDVALSLMYDYTDPLEADTMSGTSAALVVSFPLLDGGMRRSSRREAAAMLESSRQELLAVKLRARANFESAKLEYETMLTSIEAAAEELDASEKTLAVVKLRYEAGKGIQVELLDAAATVTRARVARAGAIRDALIARDMMSAAAGKL